MTVTSVTATTAKYYRVRGLAESYATAHSTCASLSSLFKVGQVFVTPNYFVDRLVFKFDTSSIPDTDVISDVKLKMVMIENYSVTDFDVQICEYNWGSNDPLAAGNQETIYDGVLAASTYFVWRNTNGMSNNTEYTGPSMTNTYVNKTGATYYALRSSRDYSETTPTGEENILFANPEHATASYRPTLIITHAAPAAYTLTAAQGSVALTGQAVTPKAARKVTAAQGSLALTGQTVALRAARKITAVQGAYTLSGQAGTLRTARKIAIAQGGYALTGQTVTPKTARKIAIAQGAYVLTGQVAGLLFGHKIGITQGSYALTGQSVTPKAGRKLSLANGSIALTGQATGLRLARLIATEYGTYTLAGQAVSLNYASVGHYTLQANVGAFALTGQNIGLLANRKLAMDYGAFVLTGQATSLLTARKLSLTYGAYTYAGYDAALIYAPTGNYILIAGIGNYALTGQVVNITYSATTVYEYLTLQDRSVDFSLPARSIAWDLSARNENLTLEYVPNAWRYAR